MWWQWLLLGLVVGLVLGGLIGWARGFYYGKLGALKTLNKAIGKRRGAFGIKMDQMIDRDARGD